MQLVSKQEKNEKYISSTLHLGNKKVLKNKTFFALTPVPLGSLMPWDHELEEIKYTFSLLIKVV